MKLINKLSLYFYKNIKKININKIRIHITDYINKKIVTSQAQEVTIAIFCRIRRG